MKLRTVESYGLVFVASLTMGFFLKPDTGRYQITQGDNPSIIDTATGKVWIRESDIGNYGEGYPGFTAWTPELRFDDGEALSKYARKEIKDWETFMRPDKEKR